MKGIIKLENPVLINKESRESFEYDTNEITPALFSEADAKHKIASGTKNVAITPAAEFDFALHMFVGFAAIIAVNSDVDFSDLERMKGNDILSAMEVGRNFLLKSGGSPRKESGEQSETTPELTTQA